MSAIEEVKKLLELHPEKYLYRYDSHQVSSGSEEDGYHSQTVAHLYQYEIIKETPKGCWIKRPFDFSKFVLNEIRKKFACRTVEAALESFKARKTAYIRILNAKIANARLGVIEADRDFEYRRKREECDHTNKEGTSHENVVQN